ncbi:hypothetical protein AX16_004857 [Volvariella volvacea WC 439]|nr:hypothetical protein AX16_004857 [Volvariella volvacea WC 439]
MGDCLICGASLGTSAMTPAYAQQLYDTFSSTCESVGYPVPSLDIQDNLSSVAPTRPPVSSQSTPPPSESTPAFVTPPGSDPSKTATFIAPSVEFVPDSEPTNNAEILIPNAVLLLSTFVGAQLVG